MGTSSFVSLGVRQVARGRGAGGLLLDAVTAGLSHDRRLLMTTADATDPARRLYASRGWELVGPGLAADQVILGRRADRAEMPPGLPDSQADDRASDDTTVR